MRTHALGAASGPLGKGWVRNGMLELLSLEPLSLTEISTRLGVSKPTVQYHLRKLLERNMVEIVDARTGVGGTISKTYSVSQNSTLVLPPAGVDKRELRKMAELFDAEVLSWERPVGVAELRHVLYLLLLRLFLVNRTGHRDLLEKYGARAGATIAAEYGASGGRKTAKRIATLFRERGIASMDVVEPPVPSTTLLVSSTCLDSSDHPSHACYFLEGLVRGIFETALGPSSQAMRVEAAGIPSCCIVVGKARKTDRKWVRDAILSSRLLPRNTVTAGV
jgi:DNA-binding transcriptional ArsR family regulator